MEYTISQLADLAGVTTRTLRWYDRIGLLRPLRAADNGYRLYGGDQVDRLQHILFYRALGVDLKQIAAILDDPAFDRAAALRSHLSALQAQRQRVERLIDTVEKTISAEERQEIMEDKEKFEAFKRDMVDENEKTYGKEIREQYGDETVDAANARVMGLTQEEYARWTELGQEISRRLEAAVKDGADPTGEEGQAIVDLHRQWLSHSMPYDPAVHRGIAEMYVADQRFTAYYDREQTGCAAFLRDAVLHWVQV